MPIPDYKQIMLPLLMFAADKDEHSRRETTDHLASLFNLSEKERGRPLPSRPQSLFGNRVDWALAYLKKAGLLEPTRRSFFRITELGSDVLRKNPTKIDREFLKQFPRFVEFVGQRKSGGEAEDEILGGSDQTPQELLESGYQSIRVELADELLTLTRQSTPGFFERMVVELLVHMGYGGSLKDAGEAVGRSGDGGIDGIIKEDKLGLDAIYIQAKRWSNVVGAKEVRDFVGSLVGQKANKGVFITTSSFTRDAEEYVKTIGHKVILIDGEMLADLMIDHNVGVSTVSSCEVKKVDADYFTEE